MTNGNGSEARMDRIERALERLAERHETLTERHEKLTERHEALAQTVEIIAGMQRDTLEAINTLARIAESHERRSDDLEG